MIPTLTPALTSGSVGTTLAQLERYVMGTCAAGSARYIVGPSLTVVSGPSLIHHQGFTEPEGQTAIVASINSVRKRQVYLRESGIYVQHLQIKFPTESRQPRPFKHLGFHTPILASSGILQADLSIFWYSTGGS